MPVSSRGFAHLIVLVLFLIVLVSIVASISLLMNRPQSQEQLSQVQQVQAVEEIREAGASAVASVIPVQSLAPSATPIVTASSVPVVDLSGGKVYDGRAVKFKYPADWRFDNKNTSSKIFGSLHLMTVLEFDKVDSKAIDPEGLLLGRIELKIFTAGDLADKAATDYIADHFLYGSPEVVSSRQIAGVEVNEVRHKNCGEASDCVDIVVKNGSSIFDWKILNVGTKAEDVALVYAILNTAVYKW